MTNHYQVAVASVALILAAAFPAQSDPIDESSYGLNLRAIETVPIVNTKPNANFEYANPDFSGSWEKDYRRSDNWEQNLNLEIAKMRSAAQRQSRSIGDTRTGPGVISLNQGARGTNIIDLARFAELVSRSNDLVITQTDKQVRIKREGESDLICDTSDVPIRTSSNEFGSEVCSLKEHQLLFTISLPGRVEVYHRFEISPDGQSIHQLTNVSYNKTLSFELVQFFNYYEAPDDDQYTCSQTLSRGKVCKQSQKAPGS